MTNFVMREPSVVFVHIPKTGGSSIKQALGGKIRQRYFGHLPNFASEFPSFAVVRHPRTRFLSAVQMFKYGQSGAGDHYSIPRWPDLTIKLALDVLADSRLGYDRSSRKLEWNLKHHLLPQTHPFNCLHLAETVLRQENLEAEFSVLSQELGIAKVSLPEIRTSKKPSGDGLIWTEDDEKRFQSVFAEDFAVLGYHSDVEVSPNNARLHELYGLNTKQPTLYDTWPSYFSDRNIGNAEAASAIPAPECDLTILADEEIPGKPGATWAGRSKNLIEHFHNIQPEFAGTSRLSHLLACLVVVLRRCPECVEARTLFWRILDEQTEVVVPELSLRWLVGVADTIADLGRTDAERAIGLCASTLANTVKLHESELSIYYPKRPWPPKKRFSSGGALFGGMITFWTEKGDLIENMLQRTKRVGTDQGCAGMVLNEVVERVRNGPTVFRRFARIQGKPSPELLDETTRARFNRMFKRRL